MINYIVIIVLVILIILQEIIHSRERKDLYNRLMSSDLHEYKYLTSTENGNKTKRGTSLLKERIDTSYRQLHGGDREV